MIATNEDYLDWKQYAEYILETTELTKNQSYAVASEYYDVNDKVVADTISTSPEALRTSRSRIDPDDLDIKTRWELYETPVPSVPFRQVGYINYFMSDHFTKGSGNGDVYILQGVREKDEYIAVVEMYTKTLEEYDELADDLETPKDDLFGITKQVENTIIYDDKCTFIKNSIHSPNNISNVDGFHIKTEGELFN